MTARETPGFQKIFMELLPHYIGTAHKRIGTKIKNDGTPVTDLDRLTLATLREYIEVNFPGDFILGEEDNRSQDEVSTILSRQDEFQWTVDGLDGTGNYRAGNNSYGAMVALRRGKSILYSAIFIPADEKLRGNGFYYADDLGARQRCGECKEGHRISTVKPGELERMVVYLEGSSKKFWKTPALTRLGGEVTTRCSFSSSVATIIVANGLGSALVTVENKPWDNWPTWHLIRMAGGTVTDWQGNPLTPENCGNMVAAANERDHAKILELLNR